MFGYASSKQTTQQKEFASKSFKCCFVGFSSSPKSFLRNTFRGPHLGLANIASLRGKRGHHFGFSRYIIRRCAPTSLSYLPPAGISFFSAHWKIKPTNGKLTGNSRQRNRPLVLEYDIPAGDCKLVDAGYLAAMDATCSMDTITVKGVKNVVFGGEGLFNTVVKGPGHVILQTMPIQKTAGAIDPYITKTTSGNWQKNTNDSFNSFGLKHSHKPPGSTGGRKTASAITKTASETQAEKYWKNTKPPSYNEMT